MKNQIVVIIGTKAQLIKMAPIIRLLLQQKHPFKFVWTGQHQETIEELIKCFAIPQPDYVWVPDNEADTKLKLLKWFVTVLVNGLKSNPELWQKGTVVLVHGDTLSTFVGAIIARIKKAKVFHIEAGLRSFNLLHPFPEELLRILTSYLTTYFACSSDWACNNIKRFDVDQGNVLNTHNNTLIDSTIFVLQQEPENEHPKEKYCVVSIHRVENLGDKQRFDFIMAQIVQTAERLKLIFLLHPTTKKRLKNSYWLRSLTNHGNIDLLERMNYVDFCHLLNHANFLISDGGSNQEECCYMKLPCLLMRKATERKEGLNELTTLSHYKSEIVVQFVDQHSGYERRPSRAADILTNIDSSPSQSIVDMLIEKGA